MAMAVAPIMQSTCVRQMFVATAWPCASGFHQVLSNINDKVAAHRVGGVSRRLGTPPAMAAALCVAFVVPADTKVPFAGVCRMLTAAKHQTVIVPTFSFQHLTTFDDSNNAAECIVNCM